jgi:hypothetical protein
LLYLSWQFTIELLKKYLFTFLFLITLIFPKNIFAITDPLAVPNNKFGIHITSENDLDGAKKLINSSGGDWGYVTIVITEKERDRDRWQKVFDQMRVMHIIPIIRIATQPLGNVWQKPQNAEINNWTSFLNSLNWVTENRYVVILNEPNLDTEWGGTSNAKEYGGYFKEFSKKLREASSDYFILPAGLAPEKDEFKYLKTMLSSEPNVFDNIDGWVSHPYPTASITLYDKELETIGKKLPVFITETGWSGKDFTEDEISEKLQNAFKLTWNDPKIVAVTPFILNYPTAPFAQYSWQKSDGSYYKFYNDIANLPKVKGAPKQIEKGEIMLSAVQPIIGSGNDFVGAILAKNTGQSIWTNQNLLIGDINNELEIKGIYMNELAPMRLGLIYFKASGVSENGAYKDSLFLTNEKNERISSDSKVEGFVVNLGKVSLWPTIDKLLKYFNL